MTILKCFINRRKTIKEIAPNDFMGSKACRDNIGRFENQSLRPKSGETEGSYI